MVTKKIDGLRAAARQSSSAGGGGCGRGRARPGLGRLGGACGAVRPAPAGRSCAAAPATTASAVARVARERAAAADEWRRKRRRADSEPTATRRASTATCAGRRTRDVVGRRWVGSVGGDERGVGADPDGGPPGGNEEEAAVTAKGSTRSRRGRGRPRSAAASSAAGRGPGGGAGGDAQPPATCGGGPEVLIGCGLRWHGLPDVEPAWAVLPWLSRTGADLRRFRLSLYLVPWCGGAAAAATDADIESHLRRMCAGADVLQGNCACTAEAARRLLPGRRLPVGTTTTPAAPPAAPARSAPAASRHRRRLPVHASSCPSGCCDGDTCGRGHRSILWDGRPGVQDVRRARHVRRRRRDRRLRLHGEDPAGGLLREDLRVVLDGCYFTFNCGDCAPGQTCEQRHCTCSGCAPGRPAPTAPAPAPPKAAQRLLPGRRLPGRHRRRRLRRPRRRLPGLRRRPGLPRPAVLHPEAAGRGLRHAELWHRPRRLRRRGRLRRLRRRRGLRRRALRRGVPDREDGLQRHLRQPQAKPEELRRLRPALPPREAVPGRAVRAGVGTGWRRLRGSTRGPAPRRRRAPRPRSQPAGPRRCLQRRGAASTGRRGPAGSGAQARPRRTGGAATARRPDEARMDGNGSATTRKRTMDGQRFDEMAVTLAGGGQSRRAALRALGAALIGAVAGRSRTRLERRERAAHAGGKSCEQNGQCCSKRCQPGQVRPLPEGDDSMRPRLRPHRPRRRPLRRLWQPLRRRGNRASPAPASATAPACAGCCDGTTCRAGDQGPVLRCRRRRLRHLQRRSGVRRGRLHLHRGQLLVRLLRRRRVSPRHG